MENFDVMKFLEYSDGSIPSGLVMMPLSGSAPDREPCASDTALNVSEAAVIWNPKVIYRRTIEDQRQTPEKQKQRQTRFCGA